MYCTYSHQATEMTAPGFKFGVFLGIMHLAALSSANNPQECSIEKAKLFVAACTALFQDKIDCVIRCCFQKLNMAPTGLPEAKLFQTVIEKCPDLGPFQFFKDNFSCFIDAIPEVTEDTCGAYEAFLKCVPESTFFSISTSVQATINVEANTFE